MYSIVTPPSLLSGFVLVLSLAGWADKKQHPNAKPRRIRKMSFWFILGFWPMAHDADRRTHRLRRAEHPPVQAVAARTRLWRTGKLARPDRAEPFGIQLPLILQQTMKCQNTQHSDHQNLKPGSVRNSYGIHLRPEI